MTKVGSGRVWCGRCLVVLLAFLLVGCSHWRDSYLDDGVGEITQSDVAEKFGPPHSRKDSLLEGTATWGYRFVLSDSEMNPMGGVGRSMSQATKDAAAMIGKGGDDPAKREKLHCVRYTLEFDQKKVLHSWQREPC